MGDMSQSECWFADHNRDSIKILLQGETFPFNQNKICIYMREEISGHRTLKTGIPIDMIEERDSILKLLRRISRPEIQLGVAFLSDDKQITH